MAAPKLEPITDIPIRADLPDGSMSSAPIDHGLAAVIGTGVRHAMAPGSAGAPSSPGGSPPPVASQTLMGGIIAGLLIGGVWMSSVVTEAKSIAQDAQRANAATDAKIRELEGKFTTFSATQDRIVQDVRRANEILEYLNAQLFPPAPPPAPLQSQRPPQ